MSRHAVRPADLNAAHSLWPALQLDEKTVKMPERGVAGREEIRESGMSGTLSYPDSWLYSKSPLFANVQFLKLS